MIDTWRKFLDLLDPRERVRFYLVIAVMVVVTLAEVLSIAAVVPLLMVLAEPDLIATNRILASLYAAGGFENIFAFQLALAVGVCIVITGGLLAKTGGNYISLRFFNLREYSISSKLIEAYLNQPYSWFLDNNSAQISRRILESVNDVVARVLIPFSSLLGSVLLTVFLVIALLVIDPVIALVAGAILSISYALTYVRIQRVLLRVGERNLAANRDRFHVTQEAFGGIKDVKLMGLEADYLARFRKPAMQAAEARAASRILSTLPRYLIEAIAFATMMLMLMILVYRAGGSFSEAIPTIGLFAVAAMRMLPALQATYYSLTQIRAGRPVLDDLHRDYLVARASMTEDGSVKGNRLDLTDSLRLEAISFRYGADRSLVLNDLSLSISAGDTIGIVGGTGSGKTTLVDIVLGLLRPESGRMLVDGVEIGSHNVRAWQRSIGYVPQAIFLADNTVAANIAFGLPEDRIDMAAVEAAARLACLHEFVTTDLPEGYQTMVGERGVRLSGGQRQRIGIARALYANPSLLVLDEATSALDNLTEEAVMDAVHAIGRSKTIIMIAHRLSTVRECDRIYLLDRGRVAQSGTFEELVDTSELFRRMAARS